MDPTEEAAGIEARKAAALNKSDCDSANEEQTGTVHEVLLNRSDSRKLGG